jgi:hypothetical protein
MSQGDLTALKCDFRYTPESRLRLQNRPCPKGAIRGSRQRSAAA